MKKNKKNKIFGRLVVISLFVILLTMSAAQALVKTGMSETEGIKSGSPPMAPLDGPYYFVWEDDFDDWEWIDTTMTHDITLEGGFAKMENTYLLWTDPSWTKMKPVTVTNNVGQTLYDYAIHLTVDYDSDMQTDYDDIRFKHENSGNTWLDYWIESYDTSSASVWVKIPIILTGQKTMYLFYGNPSATSQSDFYAVFSEWEEEWANDEQISIHLPKEVTDDPDVAYGDCYNGRFLVAWEEGQYPNPPYTFTYKKEMRGSLFDTDGDIIVGDFGIKEVGGSYPHRFENPSIAYGNGKFLVAFEVYITPTDASTMEIVGKLVTPTQSGVNVGSDIDICLEILCQADPNVEYDSANNRFLVVWEDARWGWLDYNIYGKLYDTNGNQIGNEKNICTAANSQTEPWVAFDPINTQYMIVWEDGMHPVAGPFSIKAGLFDGNLNQIGNTITIATGDGNTDYNFPCVSFCEETERYLVTWNDGDISDGDWWGNVWGKILDESGNVVVNTFLIKSGNFVRTDIVPYLTSSFFVSFNSIGTGNSGLIWGKLVSSDGEVFTDDVQLSASSSAKADWANMGVGNDKIFVAWEDIRIVYQYPWDDNADVYGNIWNLNIPSGSEVTCTIGNEVSMVLAAELTSKIIDPINLVDWFDFDAEFDGTITFDILDSDGDILLEDISPGESLETLDPVPIRLRACFTRDNPSYTPTLDWWSVRYLGVDEDAPVTELEDIIGNPGDNGWYISTSVKIDLHPYDLPLGHGSGVDYTSYTVNGGPIEEYDDDALIILQVTVPPAWGIFTVNFWSVDKAGNVEDKTKPQNTVVIKIDFENPYVLITEPANEQKVTVPFWVTADASDNVGVDRVEFDIEPFNTPADYIDYEEPYEWEVTEAYSYGYKSTGGASQPLGYNRMLRAQAFDEAGRTRIHEIWVFIEGSGSSNSMSNSASSNANQQSSSNQAAGSTQMSSPMMNLLRQTMRSGMHTQR